MPRYLSFILIALILLSGCDQTKIEKQHILSAEKNFVDSPQEAQEELDFISEERFFSLSEKWQARYVYLRCQVADKLEADLPLTEEIEIAHTWYKKKGKVEDIVALYLFLGRAYMAEKNNRRAMEVFLEGLNVAEKTDLKNESGYLNSYIADIYIANSDYNAGLEKYQEAARCFSQTTNLRSYGFAKRDIGNVYSYLDSYDDALTAMAEADSIADVIGNDLLKVTVLNNYGNIYLLIKNYDQAIFYLSEALAADTTNLYNKMALSETYIESGKFENAFQLIDAMLQDSIPQDTRDYIHYYHYMIYGKKGESEKALHHLEEFMRLFEQELNEREDHNFIEAEKKYNYLNMSLQVKGLILSRQRNILFITFLSLFTLSLLVIYLYRSRRASRILTRQEQIINDNQRKITTLSKELEIKKKELENSSDMEFEQKEEEINRLKESLEQSREILMQLSPVRKKMFGKIKSFKTSDKTFVNEDLWIQIELDIDLIYPDFRESLHEQHPDLTPSDIRYCCFSLYDFSTNEEAILLSINPASVSKKRTRIREKLNASLSNFNLSVYLKKHYTK